VGNDALNGGAGIDMLDGGNGDDFAFGGLGGDALYGRNGRDILIGGQGVDRLLGGQGSDVLFGGTIDDVAARDPFVLEALWAALATNDPDIVFDELEFSLGASDDFFSDLLHGEGDGDWYLMHAAAGDRIQAAAERNLPNRIRDWS
jgi:Ca2+-binding RTX toxin-like protein